MSDLADFLLARIAEDEAAAREASSPPWGLDDCSEPSYSAWAVRGPKPEGEKWELDVVDVAYDRDYGNPQGGCELRADAEHITRWDPTRALAECESKRRVVELHGERRFGHQCVALDGPTQHHAADPCATLRLLALPYADHPDYREEWKP